MMTAWVVTIPLAAICAFVGYLLFAMVAVIL
jgi:phosphate/sulfate permease